MVAAVAACIGRNAAIGSALETLAVVAYRQPIARADVEAVRGVSCGELLRQLIDRDLVRLEGRSEELGDHICTEPRGNFYNYLA